MPRIHATAVVAAGAVLAEDVVVGPYCVIGEHVVLGAGVSLKSHVVVDGRTTIGAGTRIFPFASVGHETQDLKYKGEPSSLEIGRVCRVWVRSPIKPFARSSNPLRST